MFVAIASAIFQLPSEGGCIDARAISGTQTQVHPQTITVSKPVTLLLGAVHMKAIGNPVFLITPQPAGGTYNPDHPNNPATLTVTGLDPTATVIEAANANVTLFMLQGDFLFSTDPTPPPPQQPKFDLNTMDGTPTIAIRRCQLFGGNQPGVPPLVRAGTVMLDTGQGQSPPTNFQDGLILIEDNLISGFGHTALKIGASVYFSRIHRNQFLNNNRAICLDNNTEASVTENNFVQGANGGPTLTLVGPMHRVVNNYFTRYNRWDSSNAPDILLQPQSGWQDQAGGYVWILDNRFMGERENFDPNRFRIVLDKVLDDKVPLTAGPAIVRGNQFFGPFAIGSVTADGTSATFTLQFDSNDNYVTQGLVPRAPIIISALPGVSAQYPLCGNFNVGSIVNTIDPSTNTPTSLQQFTYTLAAPVQVKNIGLLAVHIPNSAAIELNGPHLPWDVQGNYFSDYAILIKDRQQGQGFEWGQSLFADNRVSCPPGGYRVFENEGNNFTWIRPSANSAVEPVDPWPHKRESLILRNRLRNSENLHQWTHNNIPSTISTPTGPQPNPTGGMADPFGTNRAWLVALSGTAPSQQSLQSASIDITGISSTGRLVITFWAKQGPVPPPLPGMPPLPPHASLGVGLWDGTALPHPDYFGNYFSVSLGPTWKRYKFVTNQLNSVNDTFTLIFYPSDPSFTSGSVYLFAPQISDDDSDYLPTGASFVADPSAGSRFEKAVVVTSLKTATHTGDGASAPSATCVGASVDATGCTDMSGVLILTNPAASGTVTLTYKVPYYSGSVPVAPVVVVSLQDASQTWALGAQVRVHASTFSTTPPPTPPPPPPYNWISCTIGWNSPLPLPAGTYGISYLVVGRG
jgi:hypothetical protein